MAVSKLSVRTKTRAKHIGPRGVTAIPLEWMGPPAWRLPSGKDLAEFALQAGFLAPLLFGDGPFWRNERQVAASGVDEHRSKLSAGGNEVGQ